MNTNTETIFDHSLTKETDNIFNTLTTQEMKILLLALQCLSIKEIASQLNLSPKTVVCYHSHIYEKTQTKSLAELILLAIRHRLLEGYSYIGK